MSRSVLFGAIAAATCLGAAGAQSATYNAYADFSPTSTVWSYGYGTTGSSFTPYAYYYTNDSGDACSVPGDSVTCGEISPGGLPEVAKITGTTVHSGTDILVANALYLHPGPSTDSIVAFTAPTTGDYSVSGFFEVLDTNPQPDGILVSVVANGVTEASDVISGQPATAPDSPGGKFSFDFSVELTAGQTIDFGVNDNGEFGNNGTGFDATVSLVPEPAAWALMLIGVGAVGAGLRKSRRRALAA